jgi:mono/diheme cytochrome c family protein
MNSNRIATLMVVALIAPVMMARAAGAQAAPAPKAQAAAAPDRGAAVYAAQKCSMCHSLEGKGQVKGPLDGVGTKLTAEEIRLWIVDPVDMTKKTSATRKPVMRAYPNLPKEDVTALVAFLVAKKAGPKVVQTKP